VSLKCNLKIYIMHIIHEPYDPYERSSATAKVDAFRLRLVLRFSLSTFCLIAYKMPDRTKKPYSVSLLLTFFNNKPTLTNLQRPTSANGGWLHDKAPTAPKAAARPNSKLVVSNLHYEVTQKDLEVSIS
jgi:hypothetical protein